MTSAEGAKRAFAAMVLMAGVCVTAPSRAEDWRMLRPLDLPAVLVRATWSDEVYLSAGHPQQFGRTTIKMQPNDPARPISVRTVSNGGDGFVVDNLTCNNALIGDRKCTLALNRPNYCHLYVHVKTKDPDPEHFYIECPADLRLGN